MIIELTTVAIFSLIAGLAYVVGQQVRRLAWDPAGARLAAGEPVSPQPSRWTAALAGLLPQTRASRERLTFELRRAGFYRPTALTEFLGRRNSLVLVIALVIAIAAVVVGPQRQDIVIQILAVGLALVGLCWGLPPVLLSLAGNRRAERIRRALPYTLDIISMCLTGGMSLLDALAQVSREIEFAHQDMADELLVIRQQTEMRSLESALTQFSRRIDLPEITSMSALITQNQKLGTNVSDAVREFADNMRLKRRQTADEQAAKAGLKLLFPVVFCLLPSFFLILWGPAILELQNFYQEFTLSTSLNP